MRSKHSVQVKKLATYIWLASMAGVSIANADAQSDEREDLSKFYLGIGIGLSKLDPDTSNTIYSVADNKSEGGKIYLGYDFTEKFSVEGYYSLLGDAKINPNGAIDYKDIGLTANYFFYGAENGQRGLGLFGKLGFGKMNNSTDLPYRRDNDTHLMLGGGLQYGLGNGWALRADLDLYDGDSKLFAFGINKHFGSTSDRRKPAPAPVPVAVKEPTPAPAPPNPDLDNDGVPNAMDKCPDTAANTPVDQDGCDIPKIISLEGVRFATNSDELVGESTDILDAAAKTLSAYPDLNVEVAGHTDSQGSATFNQTLSEKRAEAVKQYLIRKGIAADLLTAKGYGEAEPVADNATAAGRAANRRVELRLDNN